MGAGTSKLTGKLAAVADAIRAKTETSATMTLDEMVTAIEGLKTQAVLTFSTSRGTAPADAQASFAEPTAPTAAGYTFLAWYRDAGLTQPFDFSAAAETATVYAKWRINAPTVSNPDIEADGTTSYTLGTVTPAGSGQTVYYSADNSTWSTTCPKQSADGTYTTYWKITAADCDDLTGSFTTKITSDPASAYVAALNAAASSRSLAALSWADLLVVAQSLEAKGTASKAYSAAVACAKAGAYKTFTYSGSTVYATLADVLHSYKTDGTSKLGLDFMCSAGAPSSSALMGTSDGLTTMSMNSSNTNSGGWGSSAGRTTLNSTIYNNFPSDMRAVMQKRHVPYGPTYNSTSSSVSYTDDYLWLLSYNEVYGAFNAWQKENWSSAERPWIDNEGGQLMWFKNAGVSTSNYSALTGGSTYRWLRSCSPYGSSGFGLVYYDDGNPSSSGASISRAVFPCFSL